MTPPRRTPPRLRVVPYQIIFKPTSDAQDVVLRQAATPDQATMAYHAERERLLTQGAAGELLVRRGSDDPQPMLRERFGEAMLGGATLAAETLGGEMR
jgi:hypothetical protein